MKDLNASTPREILEIDDFKIISTTTGFRLLYKNEDLLPIFADNYVRVLIICYSNWQWYRLNNLGHLWNEMLPQQQLAMLRDEFLKKNLTFAKNFKRSLNNIMETKKAICDIKSIQELYNTVLQAPTSKKEIYEIVGRHRIGELHDGYIKSTSAFQIHDIFNNVTVFINPFAESANLFLDAIQLDNIMVYYNNEIGKWKIEELNSEENHFENLDVLDGFDYTNYAKQLQERFFAEDMVAFNEAISELSNKVKDDLSIFQMTYDKSNPSKESDYKVKNTEETWLLDAKLIDEYLKIAEGISIFQNSTIDGSEIELVQERILPGSIVSVTPNATVYSMFGPHKISPNASRILVVPSLTITDNDGNRIGTTDNIHDAITYLDSGYKLGRMCLYTVDSNGQLHYSGQFEPEDIKVIPHKLIQEMIANAGIVNNSRRIYQLGHNN